MLNFLKKMFYKIKLFVYKLFHIKVDITTNNNNPDSPQQNY